MSEKCVWVVEVRNGPHDEWRVKPEHNQPIEGDDLKKIEEVESWMRFWNREFAPREHRLAKYVRVEEGR